MIKVHNADQINEFELIIVLDELKRKRCEYATVMPGNECVWVSSGSSNCPINEYYIFKGGRLVDVQID